MLSRVLKVLERSAVHEASSPRHDNISTTLEPMSWDGPASDVETLCESQRYLVQYFSCHVPLPDTSPSSIFDVHIFLAAFFVEVPRIHHAHYRTYPPRRNSKSIVYIRFACRPSVFSYCYNFLHSFFISCLLSFIYFPYSLNWK